MLMCCCISIEGLPIALMPYWKSESKEKETSFLRTDLLWAQNMAIYALCVHTSCKFAFVIATTTHTHFMHTHKKSSDLCLFVIISIGIDNRDDIHDDNMIFSIVRTRTGSTCMPVSPTVAHKCKFCSLSFQSTESCDTLFISESVYAKEKKNITVGRWTDCERCRRRRRCCFRRCCCRRSTKFLWSMETRAIQ